MKIINSKCYKCIAIIFVIFGIYYFFDTIIHWKINWNNYYYGHSNINTIHVVLDVFNHVTFGIAHSIFRINEGLLIILLIKNKVIIKNEILK